MIGTAFGGMITIMLMKFMLNDVPHYLFEDVTMRTLKVTRVDEKRATGPQLHYIAIMSAKLKIPEPTIKYFGEAGIMIRHLETEMKARKMLGKGGNPDMSGKEIANELSIEYLGEFEGVGFRYRDPQTEWTTFGDTLEEAKTNLANLRRTYAMRDTDAERVEEKAEDWPFEDNPTTPTGTCYQDAWRFLIKEESGCLIHGTVSSLGKRIGHAWVETDAGFVWEPQTAGYFRYSDWQAAAEPIEEARYTPEEASITACS